MHTRCAWRCSWRRQRLRSVPDADGSEKRRVFCLADAACERCSTRRRWPASGGQKTLCFGRAIAQSHSRRSRYTAVQPTFAAVTGRLVSDCRGIYLQGGHVPTRADSDRCMRDSDVVSTSACATHWPAKAAGRAASPSDGRSGSVPRSRQRKENRARSASRGRRRSGRHSNPPGRHLGGSR